jgi:hypothetical protein
MMTIEQSESQTDDVNSESHILIHEYTEKLRAGEDADIEAYINRYLGNKNKFIKQICFADFLEIVFTKNT